VEGGAGCGFASVVKEGTVVFRKFLVSVRRVVRNEVWWGREGDSSRAGCAGREEKVRGSRWIWEGGGGVDIL
jgi:hypothetical protein